MNLQIKLKRLGKKKVNLVDFELDSSPNSLQALIESCVRCEVKRYNNERENCSALSFFTPTDLAEQAVTGTVKFADINNKTLASENKAIEAALLAFTDGLFVVFINELEVTKLTTPIALDRNSQITFIRMAFLTGMYW